MRRLIKVCCGLFVVYAVATATPGDQASMYDGAQATIRSLTSACTREHSPCRTALSFVIQLPGALMKTAQTPPEPPISKTPVRPLDGSLRNVERQ